MFGQLTWFVSSAVSIYLMVMDNATRRWIQLGKLVLEASNTANIAELEFTV
jgi:hypothetical protein